MRPELVKVSQWRGVCCESQGLCTPSLSFALGGGLVIESVRACLSPKPSHLVTHGCSLTALLTQPPVQCSCLGPPRHLSRESLYQSPWSSTAVTLHGGGVKVPVIKTETTQQVQAGGLRGLAVCQRFTDTSQGTKVRPWMELGSCSSLGK